MLHIIKQIKGSFVNMLESRLNSGEGFQVFDGAKDGKKDSKIDSAEIQILIDKVENVNGIKNKDKLLKELKKQLDKLNGGTFKSDNEATLKYFNWLVKDSSYSKIFDKISEQKITVSDNIKKTTKKSLKEEKSFLKKIGDSISDAFNDEENQELEEKNKKQKEIIKNQENSIMKLDIKNQVLDGTGKWSNHLVSGELKALISKYGVENVSSVLGELKNEGVKFKLSPGAKGVLRKQGGKINSNSSHLSGDAILRKGIDDSNFLNSAMEKAENHLYGTNDFISKNIGVYGALRGIFKEMSENQLEQHLSNVIGKEKCNEVIAAIGRKASEYTPEFFKKIKPELIAMVLKAAITYGLSGGTGFVLDLFGVKIGEKSYVAGKSKNLLKLLGKNPNSFRDIIKNGSTNKVLGEEYSKSISNKHQDGGGLNYVIDETLFGNIPALGKFFLKTFGYGHELFNLYEKFIDPKTDIRERKIIAGKIQDRLDENELGNAINGVKINIDELKNGNSHGDASIVMDIANTNDEDKKNEIFKKSIKSKKKLLETLKLFQSTIYAVNNRTKDVRNKFYKGEMVEEILSLSQQFDKKNKLKPKKVFGNQVANGRFGPALPKNGRSWTNWLNDMKTHSVKSNKKVTAIANLIATFEATSELNHTNLAQFEKGIKNGRYLTKAETAKFKDILIQNLSSNFKGNDHTDSELYTFVVDGKVLVMKQNCSNVQDITSDIIAYGYKPEYFTVSTYIKTGSKKTIEESETHKENHQKEETRTKTEKVKVKDKGKKTITHTTKDKVVDKPAHTETKKVLDKPAHTIKVKHTRTVPDKTTQPGVSDTGENIGNGTGNKGTGGPNGNPSTNPSNGNTQTYHEETYYTEETVPATYKEIKVTVPATYKNVSKTTTSTIDTPAVYKNVDVEYKVMVDNWVDVTTNWTKIIKVGPKIDALGSAVASILGTYTNNYINEKDCFNQIKDAALDAGVSEKDAITGAKKIMEKATSKVVPIGGTVEGENPYLIKNKERNDKDSYTVKKGDTLSNIAKNAGISLFKLRQLNNLNKRDDTKLKVGKVLKIS